MNRDYWLRGELSELAAASGVSIQNLHDIVKGRRPVSLERAMLLSEASRKIGKLIPASEWRNTKGSSHFAFAERGNRGKALDNMDVFN